jgi:hypothetical protein
MLRDEIERQQVEASRKRAADNNAVITEEAKRGALCYNSF